ncbi:hypothetical protein KUV65_02085 [Maritalea mobilis]|uniref:hypothetical protein n=1 Tax=Maritalea mobilis TaxID=483324 RepID=UPI001C9577C2|nr:hypothetical protein [Maritalea mobilis]MBY6200136.1 hypothetical protein [Maritalea mobilis]
MKSPIAVGAALLQWLISAMLLLPALDPALAARVDIVMFLAPGLLFLGSGLYLFVRAPRPGEDPRTWQMILAFFPPYLILVITLPFILTAIAR